MVCVWIMLASWVGWPDHIAAQDVTMRDPATSDPVTRDMQASRSGSGWMLRSIDNVIVASPQVRVGDVARIVGAANDAFERVADTVVAVIPRDGGTVEIDRRRLSELITHIPGTPAKIAWFGGQTIRVKRRDGSSRQTAHTQNTATYRSANHYVRATAYATPVEPAATDLSQPAEMIPPTAPKSVLARTRVSVAVDRRLRTELRRADPSVNETFEIVAFWSSAADAEPMSRLRTVHRFAPEQPWREGRNRCALSGRFGYETLATHVEVELAMLPRVPVLRTDLPRGSRISAADLTDAPVQRSVLASGIVASAAEAIGLETKMHLRGGVPIPASRLGPIWAVRRGEVVDVVAIAGGIRVTTSGRVERDGAVGDSVEVRIGEKKTKTVLGRVAGPAIVEIAAGGRSVR